ncbi:MULTISPECIES: hypothetical protein [Bacillus cereus group]|uniref:hypothetical protein n=1 Tax=Bacillus cereus group TaxID=86661 RepID=UPI0001A1C6A2|nr:MULTISPECIES: hypothetical protein [Bacillus cereus group]EEM69051.1 hypothetical protein bthur0009_48220 [Bacillus thuringiensis serovar andalousiensis BGSC 4AW1]MEB9627250.1 hypothetical protein [Bacillus anthracis]OUA98272.1 hypothetical protein BK714_12975 [Bacillus thuringiensis serovar oswaldocruzi]
MNNSIIEAIKKCSDSLDSHLDIWIKPYKFNPDIDLKQNHFIIMMKPELNDIKNGVDTKTILDLFLEKLSKWDINIGAVRVLSSKYLKNNLLVEKNWHTLNIICKKGLDACSEATMKGLSEKFPNIPLNKANVLGGFEFLDNYPEFSSFALDILTRNVETVKVGAGAYAIKIDINGHPKIILNAFHPYQYDWFTREGNSIVVFECITNKNLIEIRHDMIGLVCPKDAKIGSMKRFLFDEKENVNLPNVSILFNGFHVSPNPIEGMFSIIDFFSDIKAEKTIPLKETLLGNLLLKNNMKVSEIEKLRSNPTINANTIEKPIFELTEDKNWDDAIMMLAPSS